MKMIRHMLTVTAAVICLSVGAMAQKGGDQPQKPPPKPPPPVVKPEPKKPPPSPRPGVAYFPIKANDEYC